MAAGKRARHESGLRLRRPKTLATPQTSTRERCPRIWARDGLGVQYQRIATIPIASVLLELGLGAYYGSFTVYGDTSFQVGQMELGLRTNTLYGGVLTDWLFYRFRVGADRASATFGRDVTGGRPENLSSLGVGLRVHAGYDFLEFPQGDAIFLEIACRADFYDPLVFGVGLSLGYAWRAK